MKYISKRSKKPYISVIIRAYNRKEYLLEAFKSAINQTLDRDKYEIIVSKNFKDRDLDNYIRKNNGKLIYFKERNMGKHLANEIQYAQGEVICFLDDDDLFSKHKLKFVYSTFNKNKNICYLHNYEYFINDKGKILNINLNKYKINKSFLLSNKDKQKLKLIRIEQDYDPIFNMSSISVKKDSLVNYLGYIKKLTGNQDGFIYFIALNSKMDLYLCNKKLTYYRIHTSTSMDLTNYTNYKKKILRGYNRTYKSLIQLLDIFNNKAIRSYLIYWLREREIFYYFHKGNFRIKVTINLIKNLPYMFFSIPKRAILRSEQVLFYLLSPEKFRKFDYNIFKDNLIK